MNDDPFQAVTLAIVKAREAGWTHCQLDHHVPANVKQALSNRGYAIREWTTTLIPKTKHTEIAWLPWEPM
jgi:hypothetical protein